MSRSGDDLLTYIIKISNGFTKTGPDNRQYST